MNISRTRSSVADLFSPRERRQKVLFEREHRIVFKNQVVVACPLLFSRGVVSRGLVESSSQDLGDSNSSCCNCSSLPIISHLDSEKTSETNHSGIGYKQTVYTNPPKNRVVETTSRIDPGGFHSPEPLLNTTQFAENRTVSVTDDEIQTIQCRPTKRLKVELPRRKKDKWRVSLEELKKYKAEHGNCIVPRGFLGNPKLSSWVAEQRKQYKLFQARKPTSITPERIALLDDVGFAWDAQEAAWWNHFEDLKAYKEQHGDCLVPINSNTQYKKLGLWTKEQRRHYSLKRQHKQSHMTSARVQALEKIGFCWDTHEAIWEDKFRELCCYKAERGNCMVPTHYGPNPKLGTWVNHQRRQYKRYRAGKQTQTHITEERIRVLDSIGFVWAPRESSFKKTQKDVDGSEKAGSKEFASLDKLDEVDLKPCKRARHQSSRNG